MKIIHGDCIEAMAGMAENSVDAVVCDPPYELTSIVKRFGKKGSAPAKQGTDGRYARLSKGFMGKEWDGTGIGLRPEVWRECLRVAKPGAYLLAFGGTRTFHRLACAIEDAGWTLRDTLSWNYGSGFPKSHDVSKAIDKYRRRDFINTAIEMGLMLPGNSLHDWTKGEHSPSDKWWKKFKETLSREQWEAVEREVVGKSKWKTLNEAPLPGADCSKENRSYKDLTAPATPEAKQWNGFGTALKPAWEPVLLFQKPLDGTYAENVLKWGCGALNIDGCRIGSADAQLAEKYASVKNAPARKNSIYGKDARVRSEGRLEPHSQGRWSANFLLSHTIFCEKVGEAEDAFDQNRWSDSASYFDGAGHQEGKDYTQEKIKTIREIWNCVPDCPVAMLDEQSGVLKSGDLTGQPRGENKIFNTAGATMGRPRYYKGDQGGASRFFYCAKTSREERNAGLEAVHLKTILDGPRSFPRITTRPSSPSP